MIFPTSSAVDLRRSIPLALLLAACGSSPEPPPPRSHPGIGDTSATTETRALFTNLQRGARDRVLFGHQDDLAYGVEWWAEPGRSDVRETAGSYPAVYGWEVGDLERGSAANLDGVDFERMRGWIREGYQRGGVITITWHMSNPVTGGDAWDTTRAVHAILPSGTRHAAYCAWLDAFAAFVGDLRGAMGEPIPMVFRPFHEMTGGWFWWGASQTTPDEYRELWRFTVEYLRDRKQVHNLLWAYSTDVFDSPSQYLARYPGDEYVDVLGFDDYQSVRSPGSREILVRRLR
jgi:mannan endo-1,4-beta-mannosidase